MSLGSFVLVLHGHLPYVLRHGEWPHGADWLYEAAAETYLPLLEVIGHCRLYGVTPKLVIGLTPVLLEQLAHPDFRVGFERWLAAQAAQADRDRAEFEGWGHGHMAWLATRCQERLAGLASQFAAIDHDIPAAYARHHTEGAIEILTSAATHGYLPLLYEDASIRAQLRAGIATSERILGFAPTGLWLPECAYRPAGAWTPANAWSGRWRPGLEHLLADEGVTHTFVETHLVGDWRIHEPYRVGGDPRLVVFGRDAAVCEQVWSGTVGYPADGAYLEFHKRHCKRGHRYWRVTGPGVGLGDKHLYYPDDVTGKLHEHVQHFCQLVRDRLAAYRRHVGTPGVVVATFDAELFGHWWHEGPAFLRDVLLQLGADPEIELTTSAEVLAARPPTHCIDLPEGSWGDQGDHRVWTDGQVRWMWDVAYRCEADFGRATTRFDWQGDGAIADLLRRAGRELLLLQSSDWIFAITRGQAVDYGVKRFVQHVSRFEQLLDLAERAAQDPSSVQALSELERLHVQEADVHDVVFPQVDLRWWHA